MFEEQIRQIRKQLGRINHAAQQAGIASDVEIPLHQIGETLDEILDAKIIVSTEREAEEVETDDPFVRPWNEDSTNWLRLINLGRVALGAQPIPGFIRGVRGHYRLCPFAATLSYGLRLPVEVVEGDVIVHANDVAERLATVWETELHGRRVGLPQRVALAVERFDQGSHSLLATGGH